MAEILAEFKSPWIRYWHDIGHGYVRQFLGFVSVEHWLEQFGTGLAGMHVHDVAPPAFDHLMPPRGAVDFASLARYIRPDMPLVLEPAPGTPGVEIQEGLRIIQKAWSS